MRTTMISRPRRRQLRVEATDAERLIWQRFRSRQFERFKFRRQHPFGPYIADFYCAERRLVIEIDGSQHFEPAAQEYDRRRTEYLSQQGVTTLRFTNDEVLRQTEVVFEVIARALGRCAR